VERNARVGEETSSRNSEVIHAGIYYPNDSIKTRVCIEGRKMMYQLCQRRNIPHRKIGKWIFSTSKDESNYLGNLEVKCRTLGVPLRRLSSREIESGEPLLRAVDAVESPETGIVDSHTFMQVLSSMITDNDADIALQATFEGATKSSPDSPFKASVKLSDGSTMEVMADVIVNSAGLAADRVAKSIIGESVPADYRLHYLKGFYFSYSGKSMVSRLAYPIPDKHLKTLGTHATLDLAGRYAAIPDVLHTAIYISQCNLE
jgi:2-hydroxyglutarate dehydrogenase